MRYFIEQASIKAEYLSSFSFEWTDFILKDSKIKFKY
jgi:hypothetical protein